MAERNPNTALSVTHGDAELAAIAATKNDLSQMSESQRAQLYGAVCKSVGLNPLTSPFEYIKLNGKLTLYAKKGATDQIRDTRGISIVKIEKDTIEGVLMVTATATDKNGRTDSDVGAVVISGLKGEALANAYMKAITKAKRRVTLSLAGLGFLDETEVETVPSAQTVNVDHQTGEMRPTATVHSIAPSREDAMKRLHAIADKHGITHDDLHAHAVSLGKSSLKEFDADVLSKTADAIEQRPEKAQQYYADLRSSQVDDVATEVDPETGEIIPENLGQGEFIDMPMSHPNHGDS